MKSLKSRVIGYVVVLVGCALLAGCATNAPKDYSNFQASAPKSILILPPINESVDIAGTYSCLSTMSLPIAEMGYYVFPVEVVDRLLKENGFSQPVEMHQIPVDRLRAFTGADAVLYPVVKEYGSKYQVIASTTKVHMSARLVDAKTGTDLWTSNVAVERGSSDYSQAGLVGQLLGVVLEQVINSKTDPANQLSAQASVQMFSDPKEGLLRGPYRPVQ